MRCGAPFFDSTDFGLNHSSGLLIAGGFTQD